MGRVTEGQSWCQREEGRSPVSGNGADGPRRFTGYIHLPNSASAVSFISPR